jgi:CRP/FNR family cyclic AMP-dependent transcriptional regulator
MARFTVEAEVLRRLAPFSWFSEAHLALALPTVEHRCYPAHTMIQSTGHDGDGLYIILDGRVSVIHEDADAHELLVSTIGPRDFFGELGLFEGQLCAAGVRSEGPCELLFIPRKVVLECLEGNARAAMCMLHKVVGRLCETHNKLAHLALTTVEQRVATALLENSVEAGGEWRVQVGSETISSIVAASREMVSRVLKKLIEDGLVRRDRRKLLVVDRDAVALRARRGVASARQMASPG